MPPGITCWKRGRQVGPGTWLYQLHLKVGLVEDANGG